MQHHCVLTMSEVIIGSFQGHYFFKCFYEITICAAECHQHIVADSVIVCNESNRKNEHSQKDRPKD